MVRGLGTVDVIILEVSHFDKAILDRGWMVALDLCRRKTIQIHHQSPRPPAAAASDRLYCV